MDEETLFNILEITRMLSHIITDSGDDARISQDSFICALIHQCKKSEVHLNFFGLLDLVHVELLLAHEACLNAWQFELSSVSYWTKPASLWPPLSTFRDSFWFLYFFPLDSVLIVYEL